MVGVVIAKCEKHKSAHRGYIAMLAVQAEYRGQGIGTVLPNLLLKYSHRTCGTGHFIHEGKGRR